MANMSTATIDFTLGRRKENKKEELANWVTFLNEASGGYEFFGIDTQLFSAPTPNEKERFDYTASGWGEGRWAFASTIENRCRNISEEKILEFIEKNRDNLSVERFIEESTLELSFVDYEPGCDVFYEEDGMVCIERGVNGEYEVKYKELGYTELNIDYRNLTETGMEDEITLVMPIEVSTHIAEYFAYRGITEVDDLTVFTLLVMEMMADDGLFYSDFIRNDDLDPCIEEVLENSYGVRP